ncbi:MAG: hypothetical protein AMQ74_01934 [Candidatus Methanofastidiosum methylothiophilum]|uniref:Uncharacterized protein n=1 Tax=Candidatus Methanofastidiosum methylothiophilum TaxID=1705564 RepID=A0A150IIN4_9EURY|nr:MAG: hypothetical protein AMQ74_01934 [Candidatus Methanofastidiosum methylthiophilus]
MELKVELKLVIGIIIELIALGLFGIIHLISRENSEKTEGENAED